MALQPPLSPSALGVLAERLGPLPLVNHFIDRIGLEFKLLDRHVPSDARCAVPHARALGVLLRSIIVEREPIYRQQETVHGFADGMFGISAQEMGHLSDDRLGRALDHLFDADRTALLTELVLAVGQRFGVRFEEFHNDPRRSASWQLSRCARAPRSAGEPPRRSPTAVQSASAPISNSCCSSSPLAPMATSRAFRCTDGNTSDSGTHMRPGTRYAPLPAAATSSIARTQTNARHDAYLAMSLKFKAILIWVRCYCTTFTKQCGSLHLGTLEIALSNDTVFLAHLLCGKNAPFNHSQNGHLANAQFVGGLVEMSSARCARSPARYTAMPWFDRSTRIRASVQESPSAVRFVRRLSIEAMLRSGI